MRLLNLDYALTVYTHEFVQSRYVFSNLFPAERGTLFVELWYSFNTDRKRKIQLQVLGTLHINSFENLEFFLQWHFFLFQIQAHLVGQCNDTFTVW